MKTYDFKKAIELIEKDKENLVCATLGMHQDWFWTAETVWKDGVFTQDLSNPDHKIAGIKGSRWATPTLSLEYKDGTERMPPCFIRESEGDATAQEALVRGGMGVLSAPLQENITPLEDDTPKRLPTGQETVSKTIIEGQRK